MTTTKRALISLSDKTGLVPFAQFLVENGYSIYSTGTTAKVIRECGCNVEEVSSLTGVPELLGGRVKTLHPAVHAGILASDSDRDQQDLKDHGFHPFSLVVVNLYPFNQTISKSDCTINDAIENIDIGGVTLLRAAAKNHQHVTVVCDPSDFNDIMDEIRRSSEIGLERRKVLALKAFEHTASYDESISGYLRKELAGDGSRYLSLKYGMNSHQMGDAALYSVKEEMPVKVVNGSPGYINILDALNGWQLVKELHEATGLPAAASFKHVSPAGAAIGIPLNDAEASACMVSDLSIDTKKPSLAAAYARAREQEWMVYSENEIKMERVIGADRMSSFGDMIALSEKCDELTAKIISREVSDGVVAPDFDPAALSILAKKKGGNYTVLKIDPQYLPSETEERTVFGLKLRQKRNNAVINADTFSNIIGESKDLPKTAINDLIVATISIKYAQSNSVCVAHRGQVIGLGAGQQSRIHCTRLASDKAANWFLRQHPRVLSLPWKANLKRAERANAIELLTQSGIGGERDMNEYFTEDVQPLSIEERRNWLKEQSCTVLSSDAFFPFRDNIDVAHQCGVKYIAHPGGSVKDDDVINACNEYGITLIHTGLRLFHH